MATGAGRERGDGSWDRVRVEQPHVLAVSGGADSLLLAAVLHATQPSHVAAIATFDHGTGPVAREACEIVRLWAADRGIPVHVGVAPAGLRTEAAWRRARWEFLNQVSATVGAPVATGHTEDDQVETVFMRLLRGSGVRGLAGLLAPGPIARPLLGLRRDAIRARAAAEGLPFVDDPSNRDLRHLRNRVRLELLPALEREQPGVRAWVLSVGERAAAWRAGVAEAVDRFWQPQVRAGQGGVAVPRGDRPVRDESEAALFWPEVAGRVGVTLDWRGTARLASFTTKRASGLRIPLSGGAVVTSSRGEWSLQRAGELDRHSPPADRLAPRKW